MTVFDLERKHRHDRHGVRDDVVGRVGFEPTVFLMSRIYSALASASLHTYPYWLQGRDSDPHAAAYEAVFLPVEHPAVLCPKIGAGVGKRT